MLESAQIEARRDLTRSFIDLKWCGVEPQVKRQINRKLLAPPAWITASRAVQLEFTERPPLS